MPIIKFQFTFLIIWMHVVMIVLINDIFKKLGRQSSICVKPRMLIMIRCSMKGT